MDIVGLSRGHYLQLSLQDPDLFITLALSGRMVHENSDAISNMELTSTAIRRFTQLLKLYAAPSPPPYTAPPASKEELEYADLAIIDLSKAKTLAGRKALAAEVVNAMASHGFFYVINHGYTQQQTTRVFSIANLTFDDVDDEEKKVYTGQSGTVYEGYKPRQTWNIQDGVQDQIEHYNINRNVRKREHPQALRPYLREIEAFARHNHFNVLHPILRLLALGLELPEDALVNQHKFKAVGETSASRAPKKKNSVQSRSGSKGTQAYIGSVTILWSQPIGGLQILSPDGSWRWVRHMDNALVINAGDVLTFLCGGFYPATRHRVVQPPADQVGLPRLGVFYFSMANDDVKLVPHENSPVLQRVGIQRLCRDEDAPTMEEWRKNRTVAYGSSQLTAGQEKGVEEEIINGVVVKHYN
ncbi:Clavaminate synthase-like protein [Mycena sanguinolenta]|uniref:Clavaminate synthase-like protein n=1 Tax=Mycena sanguinolenta TaxID=230812 RepID=A0A8H7DDP6_9AGAR|nr:Clavaminate synthase-like protein [Mycena sanguinolenta]